MDANRVLKFARLFPFRVPPPKELTSFVKFYESRELRIVDVNKFFRVMRESLLIKTNETVAYGRLDPRISRSSYLV